MVTTASCLFRGLALCHRRQPPRDLIGSQVFDVGGDGPLVFVGVGDAGEAGAVELVGGHRLGIDGVAVGDVEVDEAAGGRVVGGQGVGEHEGDAADLDLGVADAALGHGQADAGVKWGWCRPQLILPMRVCRR